MRALHFYPDSVIRWALRYIARSHVRFSDIML